MMPALGQQLAFIPIAQAIDASDALANLMLLGVIVGVFLFALVALAAAGMWATFSKAGIDGWK